MAVFISRLNMEKIKDNTRNPSINLIIIGNPPRKANNPVNIANSIGK